MMVRIILAVVIIAAVIDAGLFFSDYFNRTFAADALNSQIENENQNLMQLRDKTLELNTEIAKNALTLDNLTSIISSEIQSMPQNEISSNEILKALLKLGQQFQVSIVPLNTQEWAGVASGEYSYRILKISLEVIGAKEQVIQLIKQLPQLYNTLVIENVSLGITPLSATAPDSDFSRATAKLSLAFYAK